MKRYKEIGYRVLALAASFASLVSLVAVYAPAPSDLPWWAIALQIVAVIGVVALIVLEFLSVQGRSVFRVGDRDAIRRYMHRWISTGGRVAIWTRDMSWADNDDTKKLLRDKASRNELILCVPARIPLTDELSEAGADIVSYAGLDGEPRARFTIVNFGRDGSQVAVGRRSGDEHIIDEFSAGQHPAYYLAEDLVRLARDAVKA